MSRVLDLIARLCPSGVEFVELQRLFDIRNGYTPSKADPSLWANGTVPWFRMEDIRENGRVLADSIQRIPASAVKGGRLFPPDSILIATSATIGEHALIKVPHLSNQRFTSLSLKVEWVDRFDMKFLFYYCFLLDEWCKENTTVSSFASVDMAGFKRFRFPVVPLEVQREIVRILDNFTDLEAELGAELGARRLQYAHYRDELLGGSSPGENWQPMGEVGQFTRGRRFTRADVVDHGIPSIHYGEIYTHYGVAAEASIRQVREELRPHLRFAMPGDVVIASVGETVEDVGKSVAWLGDEPVAIHDDTFGFRHDLHPKFVSYWMQTEAFHSQKTRHVASAKIKRLSSSALASIVMPVPPMEEQLRIVETLDKFDALVNDLSIGLPAELAARRKQYEYYRDKLLTFEELV